MLDRHLHPRLKPLLNRLVMRLDKPEISPDGITLIGFAIGVLALPFLALGWYLAALVAIGPIGIYLGKALAFFIEGLFGVSASFAGLVVGAIRPVAIRA